MRSTCAAFTLADNRVLGLTDMTVPKELRESLRESACARFTTVLGPGSDGYHESPYPSRSRRAPQRLPHLPVGRARAAAAAIAGRAAAGGRPIGAGR